MANDPADIYGLGDLGAFNQSVVQNDPYGIAGRSLAAWQPDVSTWSPTATGLTAFTKSFMSGLLGNVAKNNAASALNSVIGVLPQLRSDPMSVATPEGVPADAFATLKGNQVLRNYAAAEQKKATLEELMQKVGIAGLTKKAEVLGENAGYDALGQGGLNPDSPQGKLNKELRDKANSVEASTATRLTSAPLVQAYQVRQSALQNILANINNPTTYGDLALINGFQKVQDPEGSVREGDVSTIQGAQDRLSKYFGDVRGWWTSDGKLKPEYRKQLAETAANTTNAYGKIYQDYVNQNLEAVKGVGGNPSLIPFVPHKDFNVNDYLKAPAGTGSLITAPDGKQILITD